jgi:hypothetical protein
MFRIFTNDRGKRKGVFLYSAFTGIEAATATDAERLAEYRHGPFAYKPGAHGPIKAIQWPATSEADKQWLAKHVGEPL